MDELSLPFVVLLIGYRLPGRGVAPGLVFVAHVVAGLVLVAHVITGLDVRGVGGVGGELPVLVEGHGGYRNLRIHASPLQDQVGHLARCSVRFHVRALPRSVTSFALTSSPKKLSPSTRRTSFVR